MLQNQMIFKRYEIKYLLTQKEKASILSVMMPHMALDAFGHSTIRNIYFDTDTWRLVRNSIEKPIYKEKLRMRSYHQVSGDEPVFLELKKKYCFVVYKRRILLPQYAALESICSHQPLSTHSQIGNEINYFCNYYETLHPVVFLSYEREAYYALDDSNFRITFDENVLSRTDHLSLSEAPSGTPLLEPGQTIMEIKTSGGIPLWMAHCLSNLRLYKTSFSKYGTAYQKTIFTY